MNTALNAYRKNQVQTNSPEKLVLMLYEGAIKFISKGMTAIEEKNISEANTNLVKAQNIMSELMAGINFKAGEIATNLHSLYEYMHHQLMQANLKKDKEIAGEILIMVKDLRDSWAQMLKEHKPQTSTQRSAL
ncbi:flagellar protein FliS [Desulfonispora thiosulfatigenes DSM 11270]|uniref:Flagellar secretion chaperone FliS n=1 Tax=Desulfonispora thiosulfatigenes DSM 11270 TaxID=656914 RepID=A0A1W1UPW1_DESTI|nr:flagellar export chaperone FliS [Desulfonispora thiosulfatigenes]SMB82744.1 flagellar protein FliS [Desulfonispora thiosulfatigenes DSM 11270]